MKNSSQVYKTMKIMKKATKQEGVTDVASSMSLHPGTIYNQQNGSHPYLPVGKTPNIIDAFINLNAACKNNICLEYAANQFQFILIKNPMVNASETPAVSQISKILTEFGSMIEEIGAANQDNIISPQESEAIRLKWESMKRRCEEFVLSCEKGAFK